MNYAEYLQPQAPACGTLKTFGFLLIPNFTTIGFASAIEPLRIAGLAAGRPLYRTVLISSGNESVQASNGMRILTDTRFDQAPALDTLFVVGANPIPQKYDRALLNWLRRLAEQGVPWVASAPAAICWPAPVCSKATVAPCIGKTSNRSRRSSRGSSSPTSSTSWSGSLHLLRWHSGHGHDPATGQP